MSKGEGKLNPIEVYVLRHIGEHPGDIAQRTAEEFGIPRRVVNARLKQMVAEGKLLQTGKGKTLSYGPVALIFEQITLPVTPSLDEDTVWVERVRPLLGEVPPNVLGICQYGFTEMLNNVKDHSGSPDVDLIVLKTTADIFLQLSDRGVGIFLKIQQALALEDERYAVLELSKGKFTTDPEHHSGQGIFFTSRAFDLFVVASGSIELLCEKGKAWLLDEREPWLPLQEAMETTLGIMRDHSWKTAVLMKISLFSERTIKEVFDQYSDPLDEDYGFTKTRVPVSLVRIGDENLVSRSQAKRLLARFDQFKEVMLDFEGVSMIGQAFADEIFRVFQNQHPEVQLLWMNAVPDVERMIQWAKATRMS